MSAFTDERRDVLGSPALQQRLANLAGEQGRDVAGVQAEAERALEEMVAGQSRPAVAAWDQFGRWVSRAYDVAVDPASLDRLRDLHRTHPLVFLPSHRSYLDPVILRPLLQRHGLPPNRTLGGANLDFWPLGPVARRNGYVFIRRSMADAPVYKAVLREYLTHLLHDHRNLEWYIEGGRTRTGKLRPPRYGILSYVVDAFRESGVDDVVLVPVSIVYDQLYEVGAMAAEEHGAPKQAEGLSWILSYSKAQGRRFGTVHVDFGTPLSLAESVAEGTSVEKIAFEVMHRINQVTPVTPSAIVAFALLHDQGRALTVEEGRTLVRPLVEYVEQRDLPRVAGIGVGQVDVPLRALRRLVREKVVTEYAGGGEPVYFIDRDKHTEAAFYRNNAVHHFVTGAVLELALLHVCEGEVGDAGRAGSPDLERAVWEEALRLRDLFKFEFFFSRKRVYLEELEHEMSRLARGWETRTATADEIRRVLREAPVKLAHRALGPFAQAYLVVADRLAARDPGDPLDEEAFLNECVGYGRQYVLQGRLDSPEAVSRELFHGALRLAANRGLVEPGADLRARREEFAAEVRDVVRRVAVIRTLSDETEGPADAGGAGG